MSFDRIVDFERPLDLAGYGTIPQITIPQIPEGEQDANPRFFTPVELERMSRIELRAYYRGLVEGRIRTRADWSKYGF